jgi:hypothetical protein
MGTYLVVANQTLGGAELKEEIKRRLEGGQSSFYVVVPVTPPHDYPAIAQTSGQGGGSLPLVAASTGPAAVVSDAEATAVAQHRLGGLLDELRHLGAEADGELGHHDPLVAVDSVLASRSFDEIVLSTLPQPISKWLGMDLPHRLHRHTKLPVTTVTSKE